MTTATPNKLQARFCQELSRQLSRHRVALLFEPAEQLGSLLDALEFRKIPNWIGPKSCPIEEASLHPFLDGTVGLYRLEVSIAAGNGKLKPAGGISGPMKESIQRAFAFFQANKSAFSIGTPASGYGQWRPLRLDPRRE